MSDIEDVLNTEFERAIRLGRPLSLLLLVRRDMPLGLPPDALEQASTAVANSTRMYDSAGLVGHGLIMVVLPETEATGARVVADRLRAELTHRNNGRSVWTVLEIAHAEQFGRSDALMLAVRKQGASFDAA